MFHQTKDILLRAFFASASGVVSALVVSAFLFSLNFVTELRVLYPMLLFFLPVAGLLIVFVYSKFNFDLSKGTSFFLEEIHRPKNILPFVMAPLVFVSTLLSHLCGASVGREGVALQMSVVLSDQLSKFFIFNKKARQRILVAGMSAGFAAALGTPLAGGLFGVEVTPGAKGKKAVLFESFLAAFVGFLCSVWLGIKHTRFTLSESFSFQLKIMFWVAVCGACFGLVALFFFKTVRFFEEKFSLTFKNTYFKFLLGATVLSALFYCEGSGRYMGLGIPYIQEALDSPRSFSEFFLKCFFSIFSLALGFKGGEFVPLVFMGTNLGSAMGTVVPVSFKLLAVVGFSAIFSGASNAPLTSSLMAIEFFGWSVAPYVFTANYISYFFSGEKGIYCTKDWNLFKKL